MNKKTSLSVLGFSALLFSAVTFTSCGEGNSQEFRNVSDTATDVKNDVTKKAEKVEKRAKDATPEFSGPVTSYTANEEMHDFGEVENGSQNPFTFVLTNTGDSPLIIEKAKGSCSCTVPKKPEDPIMPGETGEIEVTFKPKPSQAGKDITQVVTITANTEPRDTKLRIKAKVQPKEEEEAK